MTGDPNYRRLCGDDEHEQVVGIQERCSGGVKVGEMALVIYYGWGRHCRPLRVKNLCSKIWVLVGFPSRNTPDEFR